VSDDDLSTPPGTRDSLESLLGRVVAAPAVLPPGTRLDHYEIERVLGAGGMGTVYLARDRKLDRRVAIKLHHALDAEHLRSEAVAMARLAHPNVVTVYEIGEREGRPFVVMEYVEGETLRGWLARAPRSHADILRVIHAVGDGLAAAHAAGLVHRDVKPDNVLVGADDRARIGDFGLARLGLTTDVVAGTPAYMAPEQKAGGTVDPRADQYALAVVAREALATTLRPGARLPARFARVLARALAEQAAGRWPTIRAFVDALVVAERRPRRVALAAGTTAALAVGITAWAWPAAAPEAACDDVASELDRALPAGEVDALVGRVRALAAPQAGERARVIETAFARHRREHALHARRACRARVTKQWSPELVAASDECLAFHARTSAELTRAMGAALSPATLVDAVQLSARLPSIAACTDPRILAGWQPLAPDAAQRALAITARARLAVAALHVELGQLASARTIVDAIARDPARALPGVALRHDLVSGLLGVASTDHAAGEHQLEAAYFAARARDDGEALLLAVGALVHATAIVRRDHELGARWIANALADAEREQVRHPHAAASVRLAVAAAAADAGDSELALRRLAEAEAALDARASMLLHASLLFVRADVLGDVGRWREAIAVHDALLQLFRYTFGASHPVVAQVQADRASALREAGRTDDAAVALREAITIANDQVTAAGPSLAATEIAIGSTLLAIDDASGGTYLDRARARLVAAFGEQHPDVALIDTNLALLYLDRGELPRALATMRGAVAALDARLGRDHVDVAAALYNLAVMERQAGDLAAARATATRCAAIYAHRQPGSPRHVYALAHVAMIENLAGQPAAALASAEAALAAQRPDATERTGPAWARLELAKALRALGRDPARIRRELVASRAGYLGANLPARVQEIDALLATVR